MADSVIQTSFAGGELSKNLYGRVDLEKYASGMALMRNFFVDYRGGASNRAGTKFISECVSHVEDEVRLIPFIFSSDQAYILEFTNLSIRVWYHGVFVVDVASPWFAADLFDLKYVQSADVMTVTHPNYPVYNFNRLTAVTFSITGLNIGPQIASPAPLTSTTTSAGTFFYGYVATAVDADGNESFAGVPTVIASKVLDPLNATPVVTQVGLTIVPGAVKYKIYKWGPIPSTLAPPTLFGYIGETTNSFFADTNIGPDFTHVPPEFRDPFSIGQITAVNITAGGSGYPLYNALSFVGDGVGASGYAVATNGVITGIVLLNGGSGYTFCAVTVVSGAATFTADIDLNRHYPAVSTYIQQRHVYGGATISPELLEFSQVGRYDNFDVSPFVLDSDAITVNIASREVDNIKSLVPMSTGLVVFTEGMAFLVTGSSQGAPITPSGVSALPQASTGAGDLPPIVINYNIIFQQRQGAIVRDLAFNFVTQSYYGTDRSMLSNHLFNGYNLVDWAWAEEPFKLLWVIRNDGKVLTMTYVPDQEVYGWAQHDTQGLFKSVASVPEGLEDVAYFVVRRYVWDGVNFVWRNYLERMSSRSSSCCPSDAWHLDSALEYPRNAGNADLVINDIAGVVTVNKPGNNWSALNAGDIITVDTCGALEVLVDGVNGVPLEVEILHGWSGQFLTDTGDTVFIPVKTDNWQWVTPTTTITGLTHLANKSVGILADGMVQPDQVVSATGTLTLEHAAAKIVVGLKYTSQLQTLYLEAGSPTLQGKRKTIPAVTARVDCTRGLKFSATGFDKLYEYKDIMIAYGIPQELVSGDCRINVSSEWNTGGQLYIQQDYPLPATLLAIIPEVLVGDNQR